MKRRLAGQGTRLPFILAFLVAGTELPPSQREGSVPAAQTGAGGESGTRGGPTRTQHGQVVDDLGAPIVGARVEVAGPGEEARALARSGPDGRFILEGLDDRPRTLAFRAAGHRDKTLPDHVASAEALHIRLVRTGEVAGRVQQRDGTAVAGAELVIAGSGIWPPRRAQSGDGGAFRFADLPPGVYEIHARKGNAVAPARTGLLVEAGQPRLLTLELEPGRQLFGQAVDARTGAPLRAEVTLSKLALDPAPRTARCDAEGRFAFVGLDSPVFHLAVSAPGYVRARREVRAFSGAEHPGAGRLAPLRIELLPAATLSGKVVDQDGYPVAGARVEVRGESANREPIVLSGQTFRGEVFAARSGEVLAALPVTPGPVPPIDTALGQTALGQTALGQTALGQTALGQTALGQTALGQTALGQTALSAPETAAPTLAPPSGGAADALNRFRTDAQGAFRLEGIPPGQVQVIVDHPDYAIEGSRMVYVSAGATLEDIVITLAPAGRVGGKVVDPTGRPLAGAVVELTSARAPYPEVVLSGERGRFDFPRAFGDVLLTARVANGPSVRRRIHIEPGSTQEVALEVGSAEGRLFGRTVDLDGYPLGGVPVRIRALRAEAPDIKRTTSADDGTFAFHNLGQGPWRASVDAPAYVATHVDVADPTREVTLRLASGTRVMGVVRDGYTQLGLGARVELRRADTPSARRTTQADADGRFTFERVALGRYTLHLSDAHHVPVSRSLDLFEADRGRDLELPVPIYLDPAGSVSGLVVDRRGAPVADATISSADGAVTTTSDPRGRFELRGVRPPETSLRAEHPTAGVGQSQRLRVFPGLDTPSARIYLTPTEAPPDLAPFLRGVAVTLDERAVLTWVGRGSLAEAAGLSVGDRVVSVDGTATLDAAQAKALLRGPTGIPALIGIERQAVDIEGEAQPALLWVQRERYRPGR